MLIGISGQLGSGKDSVAEKLVRDHKYTKMALADPIKRFGQQVFEFTNEQLWGPSEFRNKLDDRFRTFNDGAWIKADERTRQIGRAFVGYLLQRPDMEAYEKLLHWFEKLRAEHTRLSPRIMLQTLGTEWGRGYQKDIWINSLINRAAAWTAGGVVVSDVRFANELEAVKKAGGKLIKLHRPETDAQAQEIGVKKHASESEQLSFTDDQFDFVITNDGDIEDLYKDIDQIIAKLS